MLAMLVVCAVGVRSASADEEFSDTQTHGLYGRRVRRQSPVAISNRQPFTRPLRVVTTKHPPYTIATPVEGKDGEYTYTGFIPDLMFELSRRIRFQYEFYLNDRYGRLDKQTGEWDGMIGEVLLRDKNPNATVGADIAAAAITITSGRERVVDFLKPFQHLGISVVIQKPQLNVDTPFSFGIFQPLDPIVWGLILLSLLVVGLFLWLMNMYNPYEWAGRFAVGQADQQQAETFNLAGSMWFAFTSMQWQGFERAPRSLASKFLTCVWFAFVTIVLVTYTAGIVTHLYWASMAHKTSLASQSRFIDLAHIVSSPDVKYGVINNSQTYRYLMDVAVGEEFDVIRHHFKTPEGQAQFVSSTEEGLAKVRQGNYAFLMESLTARYAVSQRPCDLTTVGETFGTRSYGFAMPPTATPQWFLEELHLAVLEMQEEGDIEELERRWFVDRSQCWNVTKTERQMSDISSALYVDRPKTIDVTTFTGPLVLVVVGLFLSVAIAAAEMLYYRQRGRYKSSNRPQGEQLHPIDPDEVQS